MPSEDWHHNVLFQTRITKPKAHRTTSVKKMSTGEPAIQCRELQPVLSKMTLWKATAWDLTKYHPWSPFCTFEGLRPPHSHTDKLRTSPWAQEASDCVFYCTSWFPRQPAHPRMPWCEAQKTCNMSTWSSSKQNHWHHQNFRGILLRPKHVLGPSRTSHTTHPKKKKKIANSMVATPNTQPLQWDGPTWKLELARHKSLPNEPPSRSVKMPPWFDHVSRRNNQAAPRLDLWRAWQFLVNQNKGKSKTPQPARLSKVGDFDKHHMEFGRTDIHSSTHPSIHPPIRPSIHTLPTYLLYT